MILHAFAILMFGLFVGWLFSVMRVAIRSGSTRIAVGVPSAYLLDTP